MQVRLEISGLRGLEVQLQLLQEGKRRQWRVVGEEEGKKWSVDLPSPSGTVIWLPAFPTPDALQKVSWWGMKELGIAWGEATQLPNSLWLCPLLIQQTETRAKHVRIERVLLGSRKWRPGHPQLLALVAAFPNSEMWLVLAAFLGLEETQISLLFPHNAETQVGQLLEQHKIRPPVMVIWARAERATVSAPASQVDVEIRGGIHGVSRH